MTTMEDSEQAAAQASYEATTAALRTFLNESLPIARAELQRCAPDSDEAAAAQIELDTLRAQLAGLDYPAMPGYEPTKARPPQPGERHGTLVFVWEEPRRRANGLGRQWTRWATLLCDCGAHVQPATSSSPGLS